MNAGFWFPFTVQVGIPGCFFLWLIATDVAEAFQRKLGSGPKARLRGTARTRRGSW